MEAAFKAHSRFPTVDEACWLAGWHFPTQAVELGSIVRYLYSTEITEVSGDYLAHTLIETEKKKLWDRIDKTHSLDDLKELQYRIRVIQDCLTISQPTFFSPFSDKHIRTPFQALDTYWGRPIPFGLPEMDLWLQGGGRIGELITIVALTGVGKSLLMLWWALYQAMSGYFVAYFSFDNVVGELLTRQWCAATGVPMDQLGYDLKGLPMIPEVDLARKLQWFRDSQYPGIEGRFLMDKHPRGTKTVRDIEHTIDQMEQAMGRHLDVVYVDYGDCVRPTNFKQDTRFQLDEIFSQ